MTCWPECDASQTLNSLGCLQSEAEKAAWKLAKELDVDVVTIHPSLVVGPLSSTRHGLSADLTKVSPAGQAFSSRAQVPRVLCTACLSSPFWWGGGAGDIVVLPSAEPASGMMAVCS